MIKKLFLFILCAFLIYGIYDAVTKGIMVFGTEIKPYSALIEDNKVIDEKVATLNNLNTVVFPQNERNLQSAQKEFSDRKNAYDNLALNASDSEIAEANKKEQYLMDFIWMRIGSYANADNIKIKMNRVTNPPSIKFDVTGEYIGVVNFIYDLQNDKDLAFNVDNIRMQGGSSDAVTKATFDVSGVTVITSESEELPTI